MRHPWLVALIVVLSLVVFLPAWAQELSPRPPQPPAPAQPPNPPNSDPTYQQLRRIGLSGESAAANNLVLQRDAGTFTFRSGTLYFLAPVNGKVTGAVFVGDGSFTLVPPVASEKRSLALLTNEPRLEENFSELVLRFTDSTYAELKKAGAAGGASAGYPGGLLDDSKNATRSKIHFNLEARLLQDVLSPEPGGFFFALIKGHRYNKRLLYIVDPHGIPVIYRDFVLRLAPEEVAVLTYDENKLGIWASFHFSQEYGSVKGLGAQQNGLFKIEHQELDTAIDKGGRLNGRAVTTIQARSEGMRVVPFNLYRTLRVESVTGAEGQPLGFIQEDKLEDPNFAVILPKPLHAGESYSLKTVYGGKDVISNEGGGNYYLYGGVRDCWYPNTSFGDYTLYDMTFRVPKSMKIISTGSLVREIVEGNDSISQWKSDVPQAVAGFNLGRFKRKEAKVGKDFLIESYANDTQPDVFSLISQMDSTDRGAIGTLSTTTMMDKALAEAQLAVGLYTDYFGPVPYKRLAMTQQPAGNYGQAWPELVYLPITYFFDSTARHALHMDDPKGYFKVVGPHEVAHQWWGHTVGFDSYRDQWMSEGFAEFSASVFLQAVYKDPQQFIKFWNDERELLTEKTKDGFRPIDVGPVTQGYRLANSRAGLNIASRLLYPKGGFILHMIRMMMWNAKTGDEDFKKMMQDFVRTYYNRTATTEDFKAMVEKHMTAEMDVDGNRRMDWFFNEYVYGTALPIYHLDYSFDTSGGGTTLNFKITQSGVDNSFVMIVPLYLEIANGRATRLGTVAMRGNSVFEQKVPLGNLKDKPKRAVLSYFADVLGVESK